MKKIINTSFIAGILLLSSPATADWHTEENLLGSSGSMFGQSVDSFDKYLVIGSPSDHKGNGSISIYEKKENSWHLFQKIERPKTKNKYGDSTVYNSFGKDVAITGFKSRRNRPSKTSSHLAIAVSAPETVTTKNLYYPTFKEDILPPDTAKLIPTDAILVYRFSEKLNKFLLNENDIMIEKDGSGAGEDVDVSMIENEMLVSDLGLVSVPVGLDVATGLKKENKANLYTQCFNGDKHWKTLSISSDSKTKETSSDFGSSIGLGTIVLNNNPQIPNALLVGDTSLSIEGYNERGAVHYFRISSAGQDISNIISDNGDCSANSYKAKEEQTLSRPLIENSGATAEFTHFGTAISIDNESKRMIVGADKSTFSGDNQNPSGEAVVYQYYGKENWIKLGSALISPDSLGNTIRSQVRAVDIKGDLAITGSPYLMNSETASSTGKASIFRLNGRRWMLEGSVPEKIDDIEKVYAQETKSIVPVPPIEKGSHVGSSVSILEEGGSTATGDPHHSKVIISSKKKEENKGLSAMPSIISYLLN